MILEVVLTIVVMILLYSVFKDAYADVYIVSETGAMLACLALPLEKGNTPTITYSNGTFDGALLQCGPTKTSISIVLKGKVHTMVVSGNSLVIPKELSVYFKRGQAKCL